MLIPDTFQVQQILVRGIKVGGLFVCSGNNLHSMENGERVDGQYLVLIMQSDARLGVASLGSFRSYGNALLVADTVSAHSEKCFATDQIKVDEEECDFMGPLVFMWLELARNIDSVGHQVPGFRQWKESL